MNDDAMILEGIKVLDVASFIAGPVSTTIMADFGAQVIKIEPPGGDGYRHISNLAGMPQAEELYHWMVDNRSKRGLCLDLNSDAGREVLYRLVAQTDVFVTNFMPHVRKKLGLLFQDLEPLNSRLIYGSMSAYGETGPEAGVTGFDATAYWARSGLMDLVRPDPQGDPARSMPGMGDHPTGIALFSAILLALYRRERTGKGGMAYTSLLANGVWSNAYMAQAALCGAEVPMRPKRESAANALANHYCTKDGRWFMLTAANEEKEWTRFPAALGFPELAEDPRFLSQKDRQENSSTLVSILDNIFISHNMDYWRKAFGSNLITFGEVAKTEDIRNSNQARTAGVTVPTTDPETSAALTLDSPIWIEGAHKAPPKRAPEVGEHNLEILTEVGYNSVEIENLRKRGALGPTF